ncbi:hypothetical protein MHAS44199_03205 [Mycolicibacterium hassiacum DSM 44199]|nr:hypothetical protein [Mycolicibacterium hassiacum DSM 44199]
MSSLAGGIAPVTQDVYGRRYGEDAAPGHRRAVFVFDAAGAGVAAVAAPVRRLTSKGVSAARDSALPAVTCPQ